LHFKEIAFHTFALQKRFQSNLGKSYSLCLLLLYVKMQKTTSEKLFAKRSSDYVI